MQRRLKRVQEIQGYELGAIDGGIGKCQDFIFDDKNWTVRYIVANTSKWLPGRKRVILAPNWVDTVDWGRCVAGVKMSSEHIKNCPEFDTSMQVGREYEKVIYDYYGFPHYW